MTNDLLPTSCPPGDRD